jgi:HEPN domain-containing protein
MNDLTERWLSFAGQDLMGAQVMLREGMYNLTCFHAQQCVEKALKGLLAHRNQMSPRIHALAELLTFFSDPELLDLRSKLIRLDDYYIPTRYPDALPGVLPDGLPGKVEAEEALSLAQAVFDFVTSICDFKLASGH